VLTGSPDRRRDALEITRVQLKAGVRAADCVVPSGAASPAELYAKIEIARSNGYYAAWALSTDSDELALAACGFRAAASDAFEAVAEEMIQLHGVVGFTWEYDCHLFSRRAKWLSAALGTPSLWREKLIQRLEAKQGGVDDAGE
jgi:alkylation response protein AidB-like acyl-CoA dehydrogenase